jgi:hypothetical protein
MLAPCESGTVADGVTWAGAVQSFMPALIGGVIGSGSTILAGYLGWKRERADRDELAKREAEVKAEEARETHRRERATALTDGLAEAAIGLFLATTASEGVSSSNSPATRKSLRDAVANANIAIYRLLSLTRSEAVRVAIDGARLELELAADSPMHMHAVKTQSIVQRLTVEVLAEHDALQPITSEPAG